MDMFSKTESEKLLESIKVTHAIDIKEEKAIPFGLIYILSMNELRVLREYIKSSIAKG